MATFGGAEQGAQGPAEALALCLNGLSALDLARASQVCRLWKSVVDEHLHELVLAPCVSGPVPPTALATQISWAGTRCGANVARMAVRGWPACDVPYAVTLLAFPALETLVVAVAAPHLLLTAGLLKGLPLLGTLRVSCTPAPGKGSPAGLDLAGLLDGVSLTSLAVTSCGLVSSDMPALRSQARLRTLDLSDNKIARLGGCLTCLPDLEQVLLDRNSVQSLRGELDGLARLRWLSLTSNEIKDHLDATLGYATLLRKLDLCGCAKHNLLTAVPGAVWGMEALEELNLNYCGIRTLPTGLAKLQRLRRLHLCGNQLRSFPECIFSLCALRVLNLSKNQVAGIPQAEGGLARLTLLRELYLRDNRLGGDADADADLLDGIACLACLATLDLRGNDGLQPPAPWCARLRAAGARVYLNQRAPSKDADTEAAGAGGATGGPNAGPSLASQLAALPTNQLRVRLATLFDAKPDPLLSSRDDIIALLTAHYGATRTRQERRHRGVVVPPHLLARLLEALEATDFPSGEQRTRQNLAIDGYLVVARPDPPVACAGGSGDHFTAPTTSPLSKNQAKIKRKYDRHGALMAAAAAVVAHFDPAYCWTGIGFTKNFVGSPHIDRHDINYQYAVALGDFGGGGELCVEASPTEVVRVETRGRFACVDGRFPHWVSAYTGTRYSTSFSPSLPLSPSPSPSPPLSPSVSLSPCLSLSLSLSLSVSLSLLCLALPGWTLLSGGLCCTLAHGHHACVSWFAAQQKVVLVCLPLASTNDHAACLSGVVWYQTKGTGTPKLAALPKEATEEPPSQATRDAP